MAWNAPATAFTGDPIPAAFWNTNGRDNLNATMPAVVTTLGDLAVATGPNAIARIPIGTAGQVLEVVGGTAAWANLPTSLPPNGAAGGDLAGTYPNPTLAAAGAGAGTYGDTTHVPQFTLDAKGRVSGVTSLQLSAGQIGSDSGSGADVTLTGVYQTIETMSYTPPYTGEGIVFATLCLRLDNGNAAHAHLTVNGSEIAQAHLVGPAGTTATLPLIAGYNFAATSAFTIAIEARYDTAGVSTAINRNFDTRINVIQVR